MTLLEHAVPCDGAYHVFEESVRRSGGYVPSARRGRPERNGILAQRGGGMDAGVDYRCIWSYPPAWRAGRRENRYVPLVNRDGQLRALRFLVTRQTAVTPMN